MQHADFTLVKRTDDLKPSVYAAELQVMVDGDYAGQVRKVKDGEWRFSAAHRYPGAYSSFHGTERTKKGAAQQVADHEVGVRQARAQAQTAAALHVGTMRKSIENRLAEIEGDCVEIEDGTTLRDMIDNLAEGISQLQEIVDEAKRVEARTR